MKLPWSSSSIVKNSAPNIHCKVSVLLEGNFVTMKMPAYGI